MTLGKIWPACAAAFLTICLFNAFLPCRALARNGFLEAKSAILVNFDTGRILYEQNPDAPIPPASLTKVLSMYVAMDMAKRQGISLNRTVKVSKRAANTGGSRMALSTNERVTIDDLFEGMAVSSGNDASMAVAEFFGNGKALNFVSAMNIKARSIGMKNSVFVNPHGLPAKSQRTTARDMLTLSRAYLRDYPSALRYHSTRQIRHNGVVTHNRNPLLGQFEGADGLKTGWISSSGYNLISTARQGKTRLLAVIMGCPNNVARAQEIYRLMQAGFMASRGQAENVQQALSAIPARDITVSSAKPKAKKHTVKFSRKAHRHGKIGKAHAKAGIRHGKIGKAHAGRAWIPRHGANSGIGKRDTAAKKGSLHARSKTGGMYYAQSVN